VKLLLDTHIFLWWAEEPEKLSRRAYALCQDPVSTLILSVASIWEIQIKDQLGRGGFNLRAPLDELIESQQRQNDLVVLPVELSHVLALRGLPVYAEHTDPFDRLLIAQANAEDVTLLSADRKIHKYSYPVRLAK